MEYETNGMESGIPAQGSEPPSSGKPRSAWMSRDFHSYLASLENLIKATTSLTGEDLDKAKAKLGEGIAAARASVDELSGEFAGRARKSAEQTDVYVRQHSWTAIGVGVAVGVLVGVAIARR
ncbi:MAG TPA: DUF883 family protein [Solimonas sp.]|nr:DUF883 family protein [Solimonas sp.]